MKTVAVIPSFNEAATVAAVVREATKYVSTVLVVNDCSTDSTALRAKKAGAVVLDMPRQAGYSGALLAGARYALDANCTTIVMLDADGAHDPADIPVMLRHHRKYFADLTIGERFNHGSKSHIPSPKRWANHFATSLTNHVLETRARDMACGFRTLSSRYADALLSFGPMPGFSLAYYCLRIAMRAGFRLADAPVNVYYNAAELLYTPGGEFLDLLSAVRGDMLGTRSRLVISKLQRLVRAKQSCSTVIGEELLCLHPVQNSGYIFQNQPRRFWQQAIAPVLDLDSAFAEDRGRANLPTLQ